MMATAEKPDFLTPAAPASRLLDPEVQKNLVGPDQIQAMCFTCGEETTPRGEGTIRVVIEPFLSFEDKPYWCVMYESEYTGVSPAYLVHRDVDTYGSYYGVDLTSRVPQGVALFEDLTEAMAAGMREDTVAEYAACVNKELEMRAYLDAIDADKCNPFE